MLGICEASKLKVLRRGAAIGFCLFTQMWYWTHPQAMNLNFENLFDVIFSEVPIDPHVFLDFDANGLDWPHARLH